ncbi:MAG: radical SAM protein [Ruminococcus flavefaciens]|nr:radical SAM protein [Ruminococcus flavefaciens]
MFDVEEYYKKAWSGVVCHDESIIDYIKSYSHVILWGASYQGKAIGKKLLDLEVHIENYWDIRWKELKCVNQIEVIEPFKSEDKENCLVIVCIGNRVIQETLIYNMKEHGYTNVIYGDYLYMGLLCPFNKSTGIDAKRCSGTMECRQIYCHRIEGILSEKYNTGDDTIFLPSVTLVINQRCSLKCKYCTSYMNEYDVQERVDFPLQQICNDIDAFFGAVDMVGTITVMGGEPFMHKDISQIIQHLCKWDNFGLISIATSGTWPIKPEQLEGLHDKRVNVSFSNYTESITENQKKMYYQNIEIVKQSGVYYTAGKFSPEWIIPSSLINKHYSDEKITRRKAQCTHWHQIKNGKVHPCDFANSLYSLHVEDYESDYVDLNKNVSREELRKELQQYINRPFYESCRHHGYLEGEKQLTAKAAEQGYVDFLKKK